MAQREEEEEGTSTGAGLMVVSREARRRGGPQGETGEEEGKNYFCPQALVCRRRVEKECERREKKRLRIDEKGH